MAEQEPRLREPALRWCRTARLVTLVVDLVPQEHKDEAERILHALVTLANETSAERFLEGFAEGRAQTQAEARETVTTLQQQVNALTLTITEDAIGHPTMLH